MKELKWTIIYLIIINILVFCWILNLEKDFIFEKYLLFLDFIIGEFILRNMFIVDRSYKCKFLKFLRKTFLERIIYIIFILTLIIRMDILLIDSIKLKICLTYLNEYCLLIICLRIFFEMTILQRKITFIDNYRGRKNG